jgi:hypothetical protein
VPNGVRRLLLVAGGILLLALGLQLYCLAPSGVAVTPLNLPADTTRLVLLIHGSGGADEETILELKKRFDELGSTDGPTVVRYLWSPASDTKLRTYPHGTRIGTELGRELARLPGLESIHLVAHSAGAYLLDPLCVAYREARAAAGASPVARLEMTFLDPIGFRGAFAPGWGARHHGACADYAEAFINTDDSAPATNRPLELAWTVDVTAHPDRAQFSGGGHRWPVQYYADRLTAAELYTGRHAHDARPRGLVLAQQAPEDFCAEAQRILTGTRLPIANETSADLPAFIKSKPTIDPLSTTELHTAGQMISCKLLTAPNLNQTYGKGSATRDVQCQALNAATLRRVVAEIPPAEIPELALDPRRIVLDEDLLAPLGPVWLRTPQRVYLDGPVLHLQASAVRAEIDDPALKSAPASVKGTRNCHVIAPEYLARIVREGLS